MRREFLLALVVGVGLTADEGCKPDVTAGPKPLMHHLKTQHFDFNRTLAKHT